MDNLRIVAAAVLVVTFAGALVVHGDEVAQPATPLDYPACRQAGAGRDNGEIDADLAAAAAGMEPGHAELTATMGPMHADMLRGLAAAEFDAAFLCSMIPHHQGAIEMARVALRHSSDPFVTMLAQEIVMTQEREIREIGGWLARKER